MLCLYNSLTGSKEKFIPLEDKKVKMYVCGITPYDTTHLGHAFTYVFFDVLVRYLRFTGYKVIYTQNVTDIDDDILKKAKEEGKDWRELGEFWTKRFLKDMSALNVQLPTHYVKATESITLMIRIIRVLVEKRFAYENHGNVYFEVKKFKDYGNLSKFNKNQMMILLKERGGNPDDPLKKDPLDFLLWQRSKHNEPFWQSPWGNGRPGWHIECSSMIKDTLSDQIDIHGGGRDLIFPHHESEIAQSESFINKKPFVKYWLHTSMVEYLGEKMAKSLGNLVMVDHLLKKYSANEIRWYLLAHYYREPWEFDEDDLNVEKQNFSNVLQAIDLKKEKADENNIYLRQFISIMDDDIDTSLALSFILGSAMSLLNNKETFEREKLQSALFTCMSILGFNF